MGPRELVWHLAWVVPPTHPPLIIRHPFGGQMGEPRCALSGVGLHRGLLVAPGVWRAGVEMWALKEKAKAQIESKLQQLTPVVAKRAGGAASSGAPSASSASPPVRRFVAAVADGLSRDEGNALLPPGYVFSKDSVRENRWRLRSKSMAGDKSKSFGRGSQSNDWEAMCFLVQYAWRHHGRLTGEQRPFDLDYDEPEG